MRWLAFVIVGVVGVVLQTTLSPRLAVAGVRPDWVLVLAVFFALHVRGRDAIAAAWLLGLGADFQSIERFGLLSLVYALVAVGVYLVRDYLFRRHLLTHFFLTFVAGLAVQFLLLAYYALFLDDGGGWGVGRMVLVALYSALWAPPIHMLLLRMSSWLGLETPKYTHAGLARMSR